MKLFSHWSHLNGRSPVWIRECLNTIVFVRNILPHVLHGNLFSSECERLCVCSVYLLLRIFPHSLHLKLDARPQSDSSCMSKVVLFTNDFPGRRNFEWITTPHPNRQTSCGGCIIGVTDRIWCTCVCCEPHLCAPYDYVCAVCRYNRNIDCKFCTSASLGASFFCVHSARPSLQNRSDSNHVCAPVDHRSLGVWNDSLRYIYVTNNLYLFNSFTMNNNMFQQIGFPCVFHIAIFAHKFFIQQRGRLWHVEFDCFQVMLKIGIFTLNISTQFVHQGYSATDPENQ